MFAYMEDSLLKEILKKEAYMGSSEKTYAYYLTKKDDVVMRSKFRSALSAASSRKSLNATSTDGRLSKVEATKIAKQLT